MDIQQLQINISSQLDSRLIELFLEEFLDVERRYVLGDWEPATLNGGQLVELGARIIYHVDSGNLNRNKGVDPCLKYIEDPTNNNSHAFPHRRSALHLCKTLRTLYKFRSQRGAVHIDPDYSANELDATLVVSLSRWVVAEVLRIFWNGDTKIVALAIKEIVRYNVPAVLEIDNRSLVLRTDCSVEEEILILLHNKGEAGLSRTDLGKAIPKPPPSITKAIQSLASSAKRQVVKKSTGNFVLTPGGAKRIQTELADKLSLG